MAKKKCPHCGKEVNIIPFGNRFIAVCCNEILYVGHEPPDRNEPDPSIGNQRSTVNQDTAGRTKE